MLPLWIRRLVALDRSCAFILVNQILQMPVVDVIVLPVRCLVELKVVCEFHGWVFVYCDADLRTILH